ncbi:MAG: bifunctional demethylmenaquinone methyltransferase/2-methoxy-6-polyprenyl-1,4-benzoquinol methylase UbiE [Bacteroidales bacterium]|jgi:demethylmenaquinone methyltransferase/2-methoxy-6-polyprenyl-1,4-benzoquinol methylase|nr:bifunctional demethylmenaquinone methyltransferase/2-methoxy-6-polyprenyl-1,4-benzoquinol methylase UbiE [Bacteroidales bacterium]
MSAGTGNITKDKEGIGQMFDSIARRYDFLNHFLSFGIDRRWRRKAVKKIFERFVKPAILDVATGTADMAIEAARYGPRKISGIDISPKMLEIGRKKVSERDLGNIIELLECDSENICFPDCSFDAAMVAFGVRNFSDPLKGLAEMRRVLVPGGMAVVLEFSRPRGFIFKHLYNIYFALLLPYTGGLISKDRRAYRYLNQSVMGFADNEKFMKIMKGAGFYDIKQERLSAGIVTIYSGVNNQIQ